MPPMAEPGGAMLAGLAPFRANRRPGFAGGRLPGEPPFGAVESPPVWLESILRMAVQALWAAAAAAGGAQITPHLVGGAGYAQEEPPHVARMVRRLETLLAELESPHANGRGRHALLPEWTLWAGAAAALSACCGLLWLSAWCFWERRSVGGRARALLDLALALEHGGDEAAEDMAAVAGVGAQNVREWHAAWRVAWRGPG